MTSDVAQSPAINSDIELTKAVSLINIAEDLDQELLDKIGVEVFKGYQLDTESKSAWDDQVDEWIKLAAQVRENKSYPWPNASNIKYPLLATAAMQFAARAYPSLVPADGKVVQFRVVGADVQGQKAAKADKLAKHMNYQLLEDMRDWEEDMDRLLIQLPIIGCLFKKTYFDPIRKTNVSKLLGPKDLVVNYWANSIESAHRKTEIIPMTANEVQSYKNGKLYLDVDLPKPRSQPAVAPKMDVHGNQAPSTQDDTTPYVILEQHTFWDLDDDGYMEPYVITIEESSRKVLRIVARFDSDGIITDSEGSVICIEPVEYYTKYGFIPNPDGGFYDIGFGHLLGPLNESSNTVINLLVDAGHLSNLQAGFIGKGLRLKMGEQRFQPGEWKSVNATGDDIKKQIFPLPVAQPSEVLFKLLGMLIESGRELASVAEIFTGKMPGQNTPATTTQASIEQGMKVFTAIYKRTYRALTREFKKLFRLNSLYDENFEKAKLVLDEDISKADYDVRSYDVCPTADPTSISTTQKQLKAQMLMEIIPLGLNMAEVKKRILEAQEQPNIEALLMDEQGQPIQPPPDPKMAQVQAKMQADQASAQMDAKMKQDEHKLDMAMKQFEAQMEQQTRLMEQKFMKMEKMMELQFKAMEFQQDAKQQTMQHNMDLSESRVKHDEGVKQIKEKANAQREARAMAGVEKSSSNAGTKGSSSGKS